MILFIVFQSILKILSILYFINKVSIRVYISISFSFALHTNFDSFGFFAILIIFKTY